MPLCFSRTKQFDPWLTQNKSEVPTASEPCFGRVHKSFFTKKTQEKSTEKAVTAAILLNLGRAEKGGGTVLLAPLPVSEHTPEEQHPLSAQNHISTFQKIDIPRANLNLTSKENNINPALPCWIPSDAAALHLGLGCCENPGEATHLHTEGNKQQD